MAHYRPDRASGLLALGCALPFLALAAAMPWVVGLHYWVVALALCGLLIIWAAFGTLDTVTTVEDQGLRRTPTWWRGMRFKWDDIESWCVVSDAFDKSRKARFRIRGKRFPLEVHDVDVFRPGFDAFLADLRGRISSKETVGIRVPSSQ